MRCRCWPLHAGEAGNAACAAKQRGVEVALAVCSPSRAARLPSNSSGSAKCGPLRSVLLALYVLAPGCVGVGLAVFLPAPRLASVRRFSRGACWGLGAHLTVALGAVLQIGQYAGVDQALVECGVDVVQALHDVGVKQGIEDDLYTQWKGAGASRRHGTPGQSSVGRRD